jgi:hypothetical protein
MVLLGKALATSSSTGLFYLNEPTKGEIPVTVRIFLE